MIVFASFCNMVPKMNTAPFPNTPVYVDPWMAIQKCMAGTDDKIVFIVIPSQLPAFNDALKKYDLEKYLIVDHRQPGRGVTNRNYPDVPLKLKLCVLKGEKK